MGLGHLVSKQKLIIAAAALVVILAIIALIRTDPYPELDAREYAEIVELREEAYKYALNCSGVKNPAVRFEDITWVIVFNGRVEIPTSDHGIVKMDGFYNPRDTTIYTAYPMRNKLWVLTHEALHALGYVGHPEIPFSYPCGVMPNQHR